MPEDKLLDIVINGDALVALKQLPSESVHLIITSPPYNLGIKYKSCFDNLRYLEYLNWLNTIWIEAERILITGGRICINIGENKRSNISIPTYAAFINQLINLKMLYRGTIIWNKNNAAKHCAWGSWCSPSNPHIVPRHEYILIFCKNSYKLDGDSFNSDIVDTEFMEYTRSIWCIGTEKKTKIGHPAPFPLKLPQRLIKFYSYTHNIILDMFSGSGTTGIAAKQLNRHFILIDNCLEYCKLAQDRFRKEFNDYPIIINQMVEEQHAR